MLALVASVSALTSCGADGSTSSFAPSAIEQAAPAAGPTVVPPTGSARSVDVPSTASSSSVAEAVAVAAAAAAAASFSEIGPVDVTVEPVVTLDSAVDLAVRPGDDALYVVEHRGRIVRIDGSGATTVVADLSDRLVGHRNEQGLTGLEFAADGAVAWIHYTTALGATTVSEVSFADGGGLDLDTERPIFEISDSPAVNHNSGDLLLVDDGTLLVTLGDGTADNDRFRFAGDPTTLRGSILRVRPTPDGDEPFEIPADNPFADGSFVASGGQRVEGHPAVLAWGLRNPWKIDVDPVSGSLWIADVGDSDVEEINAAFPSADAPVGSRADFGWSRFEGTSLRNDDVVSVGGEPLDPVFTYPHDGLKCAIAGGVVYRGSAIPALASGYVYADFCEGSVWVYDSTTDTARPLVGASSGRDPIAGISGVRRGPDGELFVLSWFGQVFRLVAS